MSDVEVVLLDFAGTLLYPGPRELWLRSAAQAASVDVPEAEVSDFAERLEATGGRPGGPEPPPLSGEAAADWARRDLSREAHRRVYERLLTGGTGDSGLVAALYARSTSAADWVPYADTLPVLRELRARGVRMAVVSNVGFDLQVILAGHGLLDLVDIVVESWREGAVKPDRRLFEVACVRLGVPPARVLMVGDDARSDAGAVVAGIRTLLLPVTPTGGEHGLDLVLRMTERGCLSTT